MHYVPTNQLLKCEILQSGVLVQKRKRSVLLNDTPKVISLFTCGMGMDLGFEGAGFKTCYTNDIAKFACNTIRKNKPNVHCDEGDITMIKTADILSRGNVKGDVDVVIGGPPCQSFSTAGMRRGLDDERGMALLEFIRVIKETRPKFFVFENVAGLKSAAKKHISFYKRIKKKSLKDDHKLGSLFKEILGRFEIPGYKFEWRILNAADFGVPQKRKRLILIGSRVADPSAVFDELMKEARWCDPKRAEKEGKIPWRTLKDALVGLDDSEREHVDFSQDVARYLEHVPPGGCWINIPKRMQRRAMGGAANDTRPRRKGKQGGRRGFYRRLSWDRPSPTLVTSPSQLGTCLCHPDETRPLSVREYARIQGFPDNWEFVGSTPQKYRMIGEAVPVELAKSIAKSILTFMS
jgi:DNA (cytosine-5)-methyltransferase 1